MSKRLTLAAFAALTLAGVGPAAAQNPFNSTGLNTVDPFWEVMCEAGPDRPAAALPSACAGSGVWNSATRITATPGGWAGVPTAGGAHYIGAVASGSVEPPSPNNELENFTYTFRTSFDLGGYTGPVSVSLSTFLLDNYWVGWSFDGSSFNAGGITPTPVAPTGNNWTSEFQLTAQGDYQDYFYLRITGNGRTDGILAEGAVSVPEPDTVILLLSGLLGICLIGIRRRRALV